ncbi:B12-binding domain-containing radical SAM protein [Candidatus Woesearchaeota archaeon]|nr:B12-binding domain-containing radical SAM protein [Candidatus Woesearchaeota archaeon]
MKILLISLQEDMDVIGLRYLHYTLLEKGHDSFLLFLPNFRDQGLVNIKDLINRICPDLIGFSIMSVHFSKACNLTGYIKKNFKIPVIWGGVHPTIAPDICLRHADYLCIGEGEKVILDLADAVDNHSDLRSVKNMYYLDEGSIKKNQLYPLIDDLDELPLYEHMPKNSFVQEKDGNIVSLTKKVFERYSRYKGIFYNIMASRGCPFSCSYCCNDFLSRLYPAKKVRKRSIANIISELKKAVNDNPQVEYINFQDDCFLAYSLSDLEEFSRVYKEEIGKPFIVRSIPIYVSAEKIKFLKEAGLSWISLGLQSGSDHVCREIFNRMSFKEDFLRAARIIKDNKIAGFYDVILDTPFERDKDKIETIKTFMETPKPFIPVFYSLTLYAGTKLYERVKGEASHNMDDYLKKDYMVYRKGLFNEMIRLSATLTKNQMQVLLSLYNDGESGVKFKIALFLAKIWSSFFAEPLSYVKTVKISVGGSYLKTLKILPTYVMEGLWRYLNQFKVKSQ